MNSDVTQAFADRFSSLSGKAHVARDLDAAVAIIAGILQESGAQRVAVAGIDSALEARLKSSNTLARFDVMYEPYSAGTLPNALDSVQVGITGATFGIAQSGTLVEVATNDATRLVSGLPRTHIGIVRASDLVAEFHDAAPRIREAFRQHDSNCVVSFISGPSRTGDIELILTLGVHGPESAHAIIVEN